MVLDLMMMTRSGRNKFLDRAFIFHVVNKYIRTWLVRVGHKIT